MGVYSRLQSSGSYRRAPRQRKVSHSNPSRSLTQAQENLSWYPFVAHCTGSHNPASEPLDGFGAYGAIDERDGLDTGLR